MNQTPPRTIVIIITSLLMTALVGCKSYDASNFEVNTKAEMIDFIDGNVGQAVSISVVHQENIYQYHVGSLRDGTLPNNQTIYEIGSITKTYTGLAVASALLAGKVELDKDIRHYLKNAAYENLELSGQYITLRHLMTHKSGLPENFAATREDRVRGTYFEKISNYTREKYFDDLKNVNLDSVPGRAYRYSSVGTNLVGYILESVYQKSFQSLVAELITSKSGEQHTQFRSTRFKPGDIAIGTDGNGVPMPVASAYWFADGGLTSNIESITQYIQHQLSSAPSVVASHRLLKESWAGRGSAFYWHTEKYHSNEQMLYQSGGTMGTSCWLVVYPKQDIGIFIVTNLASGSTQDKLETITDRVFDHLMAYHKSKQSSL